MKIHAAHKPFYNSVHGSMISSITQYKDGPKMYPNKMLGLYRKNGHKQSFFLVICTFLFGHVMAVSLTWNLGWIPG